MVDKLYIYWMLISVSNKLVYVKLVYLIILVASTVIHTRSTISHKSIWLCYEVGVHGKLTYGYLAISNKNIGTAGSIRIDFNILWTEILHQLG